MIQVNESVQYKNELSCLIGQRRFLENELSHLKERLSFHLQHRREEKNERKKSLQQLSIVYSGQLTTAIFQDAVNFVCGIWPLYDGGVGFPV